MQSNNQKESKLIEGILKNLKSFENGEISQSCIQQFLDCMLRCSCLNNYEDSTELLLKKKANPNSKGIKGITALMHSAINGNIPLIQSLINVKADIHIKDENGETAFLKASKSKHSNRVWFMLNINNNIVFKDTANNCYDTQDKDGKTPLIHSVIDDDYNDSFCTMLNLDADLNIQDNKGKTALIYAVELQRSETFVRALIGFKADVNIQDLNGQTALMKAVINNDPDMVRILLEAEADPNIVDNHGQNAAILHFQNYGEI